MIALIRGLISIIVTVAAVLFALANRQSVDLVLIPFYDPFKVPLFAVALSNLGIGFAGGALFLWLRTIGGRISQKRQKRRIEALEQDLQEAKGKNPLQDNEPEPLLLKDTARMERF